MANRQQPRLVSLSGLKNTEFPTYRIIFMKGPLPIIRYFAYEHLPSQLQEVSKPFSDLAHSIPERYLSNEVDVAETVAGLRKLLEAKDAIVRSLLK